MVTDERLNTLLSHANPVPDVGKIDLIEVGAATYLATLDQRSSEVTKVETTQPKPNREPRSAMPWLVAAAAVVVVGAGVLFFNQGNNDQVASTDVAVVESLMEAWKTQDGEAIASYFTADAVFDATIHGPFSEPWVGREEIAERSAGYSVSQRYESAFDYTQMGEELVFNLLVLDTDFGSIERPRGIAVVISDGLIESFVIETDFVYYCIGDTTSRCKVRETGEIKPAE